MSDSRPAGAPRSPEGTRRHPLPARALYPRFIA